MRKVAFILLIIGLSTACSVFRKQGTAKTEAMESHAVVNLCESIENQNLTSRSFYIEKAKFRIRSEDGEKSGIGTVKFLLPDRFLITIKLNTGIEVARVYLTGDSIFVNDRFNKKLFYGSTSYLKEKYGLTTSLLPVILGDYVNDEKLDCNMIKCEKGQTNIEGMVKSLNVKYVMDCERGKSVLTIPEDRFKENVLEIRYSEFFKVDKINTPGKIEISDRQSNTTIEIHFEKLLTPWEGKIDFIPGKQYEKIRLQ